MTDETKPEDTPEESAPQSEATQTEATPEVETPLEAAANPEMQTEESKDSEAFSTETIQDGKTFAILTYALSFVGIPFFLIPIIMRDNAYSLYHSKQCFMLWIVGSIAAVVSGILSFVCIGFLILPIALLFLLVLNIMGLLQTTKGEAKPLPLIGKYAVDWFKGIKLQEK